MYISHGVSGSKRRGFLKAGFLCSAVIIMDGCSVFGVTTSRDTIATLQNDLFPKAKELGINTVNYISIIAKHSRISAQDKDFLKNGVKWLNESAVKMHKKQYTQLSSAKRQLVLTEIMNTSWGSAWCDNMLRYIFEAMLGDRIYGGNNGEAGWKWLAFNGGLPRPTKAYL